MLRYKWLDKCYPFKQNGYLKKKRFSMYVYQQVNREHFVMTTYMWTPIVLFVCLFAKYRVPVFSGQHGLSPNEISKRNTISRGGDIISMIHSNYKNGNT